MYFVTNDYGRKKKIAYTYVIFRHNNLQKSIRVGILFKPNFTIINNPIW